MSLLEQLKLKREELLPTCTVVTKATGERYLENSRDSDSIIKLENSRYGFVEDTNPDTIPAEILKDFLFLGSQDAASIENVKSYGLTHILSVGVNISSTDFEKIIQHKYLPLLDLPETRLFEDDFMKVAFNFLETARQSNGRVLVHCNAGVSRAASVVLAYLMACEGFSFDEAFDLVKSKRSCIRPNDGFLQQLRGFKQEL